MLTMRNKRYEIKTNIPYHFSYYYIKEAKKHLKWSNYATLGTPRDDCG